jgi:hypothetical protein
MPAQAERRVHQHGTGRGGDRLQQVEHPVEQHRDVTVGAVTEGLTRRAIRCGIAR